MPDKFTLFFQNKYYPKAKSGPTYENELHFAHQNGVAFYNDTTFFACSINEGGSVHFETHQGATFTGLQDWVRGAFGDANPIESEYRPGTVYHRMFRPVVTGSFYRAISQPKLTSSFIALRMLLNKLEEIFETVEPATTNSSAYGHKLREILLLACMEVESSWTAVLKENHYPSNAQLTTRDYVKLREPMLLGSYTLSLRSYSNFPSFTPFEGWDAGRPTQSLSWYDAYNKTKHDREGNLGLATLDNAVRAVGAAVVMFHAQFGLNFGTGSMDQKSPIIRNVFSISTDFKKYNNACYIPTLTVTKNASPNPLPSFDWTAVDHPF